MYDGYGVVHGRMDRKSACFTNAICIIKNAKIIRAQRTITYNGASSSYIICAQKILTYIHTLVHPLKIKNVHNDNILWCIILIYKYNNMCILTYHGASA